MAKQRLTPEQTERFVALQAALRQHFFAPSLNKLGEHIRQSKKTLSRYADFGYTAIPTTLDNICNSIIRFYELNEEFFRTLPHQFALSEKLYQVWKAHSPGSLASVCEWIVQLSSGVIPETFPTTDREELTTLLQARSSAFSWLSLVLAHFFIKSAGHFEGKPNEIPHLLNAFEALDTKRPVSTNWESTSGKARKPSRATPISDTPPYPLHSTTSATASSASTN